MSDVVAARVARLEAEPFRTVGSAAGGRTHRAVRDLWEHRQLLGMLVRRELKSRYKDSAGGFVWSLARPLAMLIIYYVALGKFLGAERNIPEFAIFIYTGLTAWGLYSEIISVGTASVVANSGLIKKVYFPREIFPLSVVGSALFNFVIQITILLAATVVAGSFPTGTRWLYFPLALAVLGVWAVSWALLLSAVNVFLRDVQYLVEIVLLVAFWASPIVYSFALVSTELTEPWMQQLYLTNPLTVGILGFQHAFWVGGDGQPPIADLPLMLGAWFVGGLVFLWVAHRVFMRLQGNFAQEL